MCLLKKLWCINLSSKAQNQTLGIKNSREPNDDPASETIWVFIIGDMCMFSTFFLLYLFYRGNELELFQQSQQQLNLHIGSINTLALLASSWLVVMALFALRQGKRKKSSNLTLVALFFGVLFMVSKVFEYQQKFDAGISFETNNFFLFYFMLTGVHLAHLICGLGLLAWLAYSVRVTEKYSPEQETTFELCAIFWHMVDLLWVLIFPLLYLLP